MKSEQPPVKKSRIIIFLIVSFMGCIAGFKLSTILPYDLAFPVLIAIIFVIGIYFTVIFADSCRIVEKRMRTETLNNLIKDDGFMTPDEFFSMCKRYTLADPALYNPGVYLIFNRTKKICRVHTSMDIMKGVYLQLTGLDDYEIYSDLKRGDRLDIKLIRLKKSGFDNLIELERACLLKVRAHVRGIDNTE